VDPSYCEKSNSKNYKKKMKSKNVLIIEECICVSKVVPMCLHSNPMVLIYIYTIGKRKLRIHTVINLRTRHGY